MSKTTKSTTKGRGGNYYHEVEDSVREYSQAKTDDTLTKRIAKIRKSKAFDADEKADLIAALEAKASDGAKPFRLSIHVSKTDGPDMVNIGGPVRDKRVSVNVLRSILDHADDCRTWLDEVWNNHE